MAIVTANWTQDLFLCVTFFFLIFYLYLTRNFNYWKKLGVKYLSPSVFFGNIGPCILGRKPPYKFIEEAYQAGNGEQLLGFYAIDRPYLMVRDPELIRHIFVKDFHNFSNKLLSGNENDTLGNVSLFLAHNPPWQHIRQKVTPIFTSVKLKKMFDLMLEICEDFQVYCDNLGIDDKIGKPVEVKEACANLTTDFIGITAFGLKLNSLTNPNAEFRAYGRNMFRSSYKRYLQMLSILFVPALRRYTNAQFFDRKGTEFFRTTFWHVINERIRMGNKRNDLVDILIEIQKSQEENNNTDSFKLEGDGLVAQAAIFFSGGFETSSTTMYFALYELAKNQDIQNRLRKEIVTAMEKEGGKITYDAITTLPYLNMVVYEILRLYPILSWLDRLPENDYTFPGTNITVKKNTPLILPMRALHMDPNYFPNPEKFDPERFSSENKNIVPFTFFPFGQGPRSCIGERLGLIQTKLGLVNFVTRYEISVCKETPIPMKYDRVNVFTHAEGGLYLNLRKLVK